MVGLEPLGLEHGHPEVGEQHYGHGEKDGVGGGHGPSSDPVEGPDEPEHGRSEGGDSDEGQQISHDPRLPDPASTGSERASSGLKNF
jgi:hypothetical protein